MPAPGSLIQLVYLRDVRTYVYAFHFPCLEILIIIHCTYIDCTILLRDDDVYEGVERLYLELDYSPRDSRVQIIPDRKRATIYINDPEDGTYACAVVSIGVYKKQQRP